MTDHMRDNPHYSISLPDAAATSDGRAIADATLALAYEQRTANLVRYVRHIDDTDYELQSMIAHRLGLNND